MKIRLLAITYGVLVVASISQVWAENSSHHSTSGFQALAGAKAQNFIVPSNAVFVRKDTLKQGRTAERYQQLLDNAEVLGGQLTLIRDVSGQITTVIGNHYPNLLTTNVINLKPESAKSVAIKQLGGEGQWMTTLMINPQNGRFFYRVENRRDDSRWFYWIDTENGSVVNAYDGLAHSVGTGVLGDTKDLSSLTRERNGIFELVSSDGRITTYDARNRSRLPGNLATDDNDEWNTLGTISPAQPAMVDAHFYASVTDNYYLSTFSFDWLIHYPQGMVSSAHVQRNYSNAYWNGQQMAYGDGDGSTFRELSGDLDVVGHELSHGVTEATSNLIYQNESGALNEAFSDIMGTNIEFSFGTGNWTIGEDINIGDNGIRNMENPAEDGDPSHYADRYTGTSDNGGVHTNSGIANHWYYLLVNGGQNANASRAGGTDLQKIDIAIAQNIVYEGFTSLPSTATFCDARASTIAVAGSYDVTVTVADAWDEVGVDEATCNSGGGGGSGDAEAPVITNVSSKLQKGTRFVIMWTTDIPSTTEVIFTCCGSYSDSSLVTSHSMSFNGQKGVEYTYFVSSANSDGVKSTEGPFTHKN